MIIRSFGKTGDAEMNPQIDVEKRAVDGTNVDAVQGVDNDSQQRATGSGVRKTVDFIHIGMPKAGSTWLQDVFFEQSPDIGVLGSRHGNKQTENEFIKEVRSLVWSSDLAIDQEAVRDRIVALVARHADSLKKTNALPRLMGISHEVLSGKWLTGKNAGAIAQTFRQIFPNAKVIIFLRNQKSMILSSYKQYIRGGGTAPFKRFLMDPRASSGLRHDARPFNTNLVEYFKYSRIVRTYVNIFGPHNVHIDCLERLREAKQDVVDELCSFLGTDRFQLHNDQEVNRQLPETALSVLRQVNKLFSTFYNPYGLLPQTALSLLLKPFFRNHLKHDKSKCVNPYVKHIWLHCAAQRSVAKQLDLVFGSYLLRPISRSSPRNLLDKLPGEYRNWLFEQYSRDNRKLQDFLTFPLKPLGYEI